MVFLLKELRSRRYPAESTTDAHYVDDLELPDYTTGQPEYLPYSLEQKVWDIGLNVNTNKTVHVF